MSAEFADTVIPRLAIGFRFQWEPAQNCHVLLFPEGMVKLNESAAAILEQVDGKRDLATIIAALEARFPGTDLSADVREFFAQAVTRGWLHVD